MSADTDHLDAILATLETAGAVPYTVQQVKRVSVLPPAYNEVTLLRRFGGAFRNTATTGTVGYRIVIHSFGRTHEGAFEMRELARTALERARLTINGKTTVPVLFESEDSIDDDEPGWYSGPSSYTYTH